MKTKSRSQGAFCTSVDLLVVPVDFTIVDSPRIGGGFQFYICIKLSNQNNAGKIEIRNLFVTTVCTR